MSPLRKAWASEGTWKARTNILLLFLEHTRLGLPPGPSHVPPLGPKTSALQACEQLALSPAQFKYLLHLGHSPPQHRPCYSSGLSRETEPRGRHMDREEMVMNWPLWSQSLKGPQDVQPASSRPRSCWCRSQSESQRLEGREGQRFPLKLEARKTAMPQLTPPGRRSSLSLRRGPAS